MVVCGVCPVALLVNYVVRVHELVCTNVCCVMGIFFFFIFGEAICLLLSLVHEGAG